MPVVTSPKYVLRSLARCDEDGFWFRDRTTVPMARTTTTAKTHSGGRLEAQPLRRSGMNGGSVCVGEVMRWSGLSGSRVHQAEALGELGLGHRAEHVVHDAVLCIKKERLREPVDVVVERDRHLRVKPDRVGDALSLGEL